jgi:hypothetical protein
MYREKWSFEGKYESNKQSFITIAEEQSLKMNIRLY